jgi:hypothetical protein
LGVPRWPPSVSSARRSPLPSGAPAHCSALEARVCRV